MCEKVAQVHTGPLAAKGFVNIDETKFEIKTKSIGVINVFVQGETAVIRDTTPVYFTVHDIGSNHTSFHKLSEHPCMDLVKKRSVFMHIEIPGQEFNAPDFPDNYRFPSLQEIADELVAVLDFFKVKYVIGVGVGAGANILARFAIAHPERVLGNVLIHCSATVAGIMEYFSDKLMSWKLQTVGMNLSAELYLLFHKFGAQMETTENKDKVIREYQKKLVNSINPNNLRHFVEAFLNRSDISVLLFDQMKIDTLLVAAGNSPHLHDVYTMQTYMNPRNTTMLKVDDIEDVLNEKPHRLAHNLILFCQGLGLLSTLQVSKISFSA